MLATITHFLATHFLAMLMLSVGLRTDRALFHELRARGPLLARALVIVWLIVPMLALTVLYALRPPQFVAITLMVMAICPALRAERVSAKP